MTALQTLIVRYYSSFDTDMKLVLQIADLMQLYIALAHTLWD